MNCTTQSESALGFQVVAQLKSASEVQKLYSNQSMDTHTPVTVEVERDGLYWVTALPLGEGRGIVDSSTIYTRLVTVMATKNGARTEVTSTFEASSTPLLPSQPEKSQTGGLIIHVCIIIDSLSA